MARTRVFIKPFDTSGNYETNFTEITGDVIESSLNSIKRELDATEYDAGVFKFGRFKIKLSNEHGRYSDVGSLRSIFSYKRSDSIIKITWSPNNDELFPGVIKAGQVKLIPTTELVLFEGLINDEATLLDIEKQETSFHCFGYEYLFNRMEVPFSELNIGDTFESIIFDCLNQEPFTDHVSVLIGNLTLGTDVATDAIADLENKTVKEALDKLLVLSNSVLYIKNNIVYVVDRTESASVEYNFYGQASNTGIENIQRISKYRAGLNRFRNLWTWKDTALDSRYQDTIDKFGIRKKEISSKLITGSSKQQTILDGLRTEFGPVKRELELITALDFDRFNLGLLDKIDIDYPTVYKSADGNALPLYGVAVYGTAKFPYGEWSLTIEQTDKWKIMAIKYNIKKALIIFTLKEV